MALRLSFVRETNPISQMTQNLTLHEKDPSVKLVILQANGKAFCSGGDLVSIVTSSIVESGHWSFAMLHYKKLLTLSYLLATHKQPVVSLMNGMVMGAGAGLSMNGTFRVVTEKAVFVMPGASIGYFPDMGEYLGLTGRHLNGAEMVERGLATHLSLPSFISRRSLSPCCFLLPPSESAEEYRICHCEGLIQRRYPLHGMSESPCVFVAVQHFSSSALCDLASSGFEFQLQLRVMVESRRMSDGNNVDTPLKTSLSPAIKICLEDQSR
ncbi:probable 3-hydroxyisobutyryl-CoA hydrolase 3 [Neltuma alba]|uniref:probable 3-hydroxyisobutyryl-CoA hydrolase 3 n=1 Tax=Neltuma alba TaxID=207710 RepID=UPI0010A3E75A|nr:probable 3-hydroxyisobutyryl-CoA hydrolase 3 [Prosopis alba]